MTNSNGEVELNSESLYVAAVREFRKAGVTRGGRFSATAAALCVSLGKRGAAADIAKLRRSGLHHETLFVTSMFMQFAPALDETFKMIFGDAKQN